MKRKIEEIIAGWNGKGFSDPKVLAQFLIDYDLDVRYTPKSRTNDSHAYIRIYKSNLYCSDIRRIVADNLQVRYDYMWETIVIRTIDI